VFVAKEMMVQAGSTKPCSLQKVLSEVIYVRSKDITLVRILTDLRLTSAIDTINRHDNLMLKHLMGKWREASPFSFQIFSTDKVDFTKRGAHAGKQSLSEVQSTK
jgi:hypothetical protein